MILAPRDHPKKSLRVGSLFSGIGGFDLGLERAGMKIIWQVENDPYCAKVLAKHWPDVKRYGDIKTIDWSEVERPDLICGGFPCQPVSHAGKRLAQDDPRWLWPWFRDSIRALRPRFVLVENVPGLLSAGMSDILGDLAESGYDAEWDCIPAAAVGAPHLRYRLWLVAYPKIFPEWTGLRTDEQTQERGGRSGDSSGESYLPDSDHTRCAQQRGTVASSAENTTAQFGSWWAVEPAVGRVAHGVPHRVDRLRGLGNAVVPQVVEWIGRRIMEVGRE